MMSKLLVGGIPACPVLHADEDFEDWLAITAGLYSSDTASLLQSLGAIMEWPRDLRGEMERSEELKRAVEVELRSVFATPGGPAVSPGPQGFQVYCPLCFHTDLRSGCLPYFRTAWGHALTTMCEVHRTPLFRWSSGAPRNPKGLPKWIIANYRQGRSLMRRTDRPKEADKYRLRLHLGREALSWYREKSREEPRLREQHYVLEQQLAWERGLRDPDRYDLIRGVAGSDPKAFRRAFDDLCVVYLADFGADWGESHPLSNYSYMGPGWLFGAPERLPFKLIHLRAPLAQMPNPAHRRSVIALVMRTLVGFSADVVCDDFGKISDAGGTALTVDLENLSTAAKDFLAGRSGRWPPFVRAGMRRALQ